MFVTEVKVMGDSGTEYAITFHPETGTACSCPAFEHGGGNPCKHMKYVAERMLKRPRQASRSGKVDA